MVKYILLVFLIIAPFFKGSASHIVGGEFEMKHLSNNIYRLSLNLYFDNNGNPGALDDSITLDIFRKSDNQHLERVIMKIKQQTGVPYTNPGCAVGELSTDRILYWKDVELFPAVYNDPEGYYMVWERCCRNNGVDNIVAPGETGQAFYLEFPPLEINGQPFINSSPVLFPPLSDYACVNQLFYFDFSGTDPDGDSLVYSMVTPYRGASTASQPILQLNSTAPYSLVSWLPGYNTNNQITGPEPLNINPVTGLLRVIPDQTGLFVFSVKCEEFRNGEKIGEVRRDFQLLVRNCQTNAAPQLTVYNGTASTPYQPGQVLNIGGGDDNCFTFSIKDPDPNEFVTIIARALNFPGGTLLTSSGAINNQPGNDSLTINFCLPQCQQPPATPYLVEVIVKDNGCALPKKDTIQIAFTYTLPVNQAPAINTSLPGNVVTANVGEIVNFTINGVDPDNGRILMKAVGDGFNLASINMFFQVSGLSPLTMPFGWQANCQAAQISPFTVHFIVQDTMCLNDKVDTVSVLFNILAQPNILPEAGASVTQATVQVFNSISFPVFATDLNPSDQLKLTMAGNGFNPASLGMVFNPVQGVSPIQGNFSWTPGCNALTPGTYELFFIAQDFPCSTTQPDTHRVLLVVEFINQAPQISQLPVVAEMVGNTVQIPVTASDPDNNQLTITAASGGLNLADYGISFSPVTGTGQAEGVITWTPNCASAALPENIRIWLIATESTCPPNQSDSSELILQTIYNNQAPLISIQQSGSQAPQPLSVEIEIGQELTFDVLGADADYHLLTLLAAGENFDLATSGIQFTPSTANGQVQSTFKWVPDCSHPGPGNYSIRFNLSEQTCQPRDTGVTVYVKVIEPQPIEEFIPSNIFTPNGDGVNDVFEFPTLPPDNCADKFVRMILFNRWGKKIVSSPSRNFSWDGNGAPEGIYYYLVEFEKKLYKGYVTLVR